jgi:hypothetical protein
MTITAHALRGARVVRAATLAAVAALVVGLVALQAFQASYGRHVTRVVTQSDTQSAQLLEAVAQQAARGRSCTQTPALTDVVLYQGLDTDEIVVVTFDEALTLATAGSGWVRGYCL